MSLQLAVGVFSALSDLLPLSFFVKMKLKEQRWNTNRMSPMTCKIPAQVEGNDSSNFPLLLF